MEMVVMTQHLYKHFNPEVHKIESKIATVRTGHHCKFNINYHIIWIQQNQRFCVQKISDFFVPKYRKPVLKGKVKDVLSTIIHGICYDIRLNMLALEIMPDHLHLFVGARPTHHPADIVKRLKGNTSIQLRRCFIQLKYLGYKC